MLYESFTIISECPAKLKLLKPSVSWPIGLIIFVTSVIFMVLLVSTCESIQNDSRHSWMHTKTPWKVAKLIWDHPHSFQINHIFMTAVRKFDLISHTFDIQKAIAKQPSGFNLVRNVILRPGKIIWAKTFVRISQTFKNGASNYKFASSLGFIN